MRSLAMLCVAGTLLLLMQAASASDPELTQDFFVPDGVNSSMLDGNFFTFKGLRNGPKAAPGSFKPIKAFADAFPALSGLGISAALLEFQPGSQNTPHTHPRATELFYVVDGSVMVGLVDTAGHLFNQTLYKGDLFVFPKGLVHFQVNPASYAVKKTAYAFAAFSSANPGIVSLPATLFGSGISSAVLTQAFNVDGAALAQLEAPFPPK